MMFPERTVDALASMFLAGGLLGFTLGCLVVDAGVASPRYPRVAVLVGVFGSAWLTWYAWRRIPDAQTLYELAEKADSIE